MADSNEAKSPAEVAGLLGLALYLDQLGGGLAGLSGAVAGNLGPIYRVFTGPAGAAIGISTALQKVDQPTAAADAFAATTADFGSVELAEGLTTTVVAGLELLGFTGLTIAGVTVSAPRHGRSTPS
jgi:hypothetical protein